MTITTAVVVTLGHDGLTVPVPHARQTIRAILKTHGANLLGEFPDGQGQWDDPEHGQPVREACDAWLALVPTHNLPHVRTCLAHTAARTGQNAIGLIIHDHDTYGPSYVTAEQEQNT